MDPTIADIEDIVRKWIQSNNLLPSKFEAVVSGKTSDSAVIRTDHMFWIGTFSKIAGCVFLRLSPHGASMLPIDDLMYLTCTQLTIWKDNYNVFCWMGHLRPTNSGYIPCLECEHRRHILRCVRKVGPIWLLARDICGLLPDVHRWIGQILAQVGRG